MNGAVYFAASYYLLDPIYHAWMGLFAVAIAAVHLALAVQLWTARAGASPDLRPIHLSLGVAVAALTLAAPIQFTAYRITMAWALEFLAITWIGVRARSTLLENAGVLIAALMWIRLATIDTFVYPDAQSYTLIWNSRFLTFCIAAACSWLCSYWSRPRSSGLVQYIAGHAIMLWGLTLETVGWAARTTDRANILSVETVSITILFAIYAVILVSIGVAGRSVVNRVAGLALMGVVILKLYVFDVWQIDRIYRISAFVALGVLLLTTSFLYSHLRVLVERLWKGEQTPS